MLGIASEIGLLISFANILVRCLRMSGFLSSPNGWGTFGKSRVDWTFAGGPCGVLVTYDLRMFGSITPGTTWPARGIPKKLLIYCITHQIPIHGMTFRKPLLTHKSPEDKPNMTVGKLLKLIVPSAFNRSRSVLLVLYYYIIFMYSIIDYLYIIIKYQNVFCLYILYILYITIIPYYI